MENTETVNISAYSLLEFCQQAQDLLQQGYKFDFDSNERHPQSFGTLLVAGLVKVDEEQTVADALEQICSEEQAAQKAKAQAEDKPVVKAGRKPKVSAE